MRAIFLSTFIFSQLSLPKYNHILTSLHFSPEYLNGTLRKRARHVVWRELIRLDK